VGEEKAVAAAFLPLPTMGENFGRWHVHFRRSHVHCFRCPVNWKTEKMPVEA
jgi:hypothetical protein